MNICRSQNAVPITDVCVAVLAPSLSSCGFNRHLTHFHFLVHLCGALRKPRSIAVAVRLVAGAPSVHEGLLAAPFPGDPVPGACSFGHRIAGAMCSPASSRLTTRPYCLMSFFPVSLAAQCVSSAGTACSLPPRPAQHPPCGTFFLRVCHKGTCPHVGCSWDPAGCGGSENR